MRLLPWHSVFWSGRIYPAGNDAYYHLRRIAFGVERFPELLGFDRYLNFPAGARAIWPPLFDGALAALGRLAVGPGQPERLEAAMMFVPPVLGALTAVATFAIGVRYFSRREAWLAALLVAGLPAASFHSQLGFLDHHAPVALVATGLLACLLACAEQPSALRSLATGATMGVALLLWPGCLLHVAVLQLGLLGRALLARDHPGCARALRHAALAALVAAAVVAPFGIAQAREWERWGPLSPLVLSDFQPLWLAASAGGQALLAWLYARLRVQQPLARCSLAAGLSVGSAFAALAFGPRALRAGAGEAWAWLSASERFQAAVAESSPLFVRAGHFDVRDAEELFTRALYLAPIGLAWAAAGLLRGRRPAAAGARADPRPGEGVWLWWTSAFFAAALLQFRFANSFAPTYALLLARMACAGFDALRPRTLGGTGPAARVARIASIGAACALLAAPSLRFYGEHLRNIANALRGGPVHYAGTARSHPLLSEVARWLAQNTPATSGYLDPSREPEYGVLAAWGDGHLLRYRAQRPMVQDNFGDDVAPQNVELAERYFAATSEAEGLGILDSLRVRWVVVRPGGSGFARGYAATSMFERLERDRGSARPRVAGATAPAALSRHRLRFETPPWPGFGTARPGRYQVYEIVDGALVTGRAEGGAAVHAHLPLAIATRKERTPIAWHASTTADARGCYRLRVPHPTEPESGNVLPSGPLELESGSRRAQLRIPIAAVHTGGAVAGPRLDASTARDPEALDADPCTRVP